MSLTSDTTNHEAIGRRAPVPVCMRPNVEDDTICLERLWRVSRIVKTKGVFGLECCETSEQGHVQRTSFQTKEKCFVPLYQNPLNISSSSLPSELLTLDIRGDLVTIELLK